MSDFGDVSPPFWLVWCRQGRSPVYEHESYLSARREAERLARAHPGNAFYVLAPAARGGSDRQNVHWSHYTATGIDSLDDLNGEHAVEVVE